MNKFKVALVQYDTTEPNNAENTEFAIRLIKEAKRENADFVLFPECFITSYSAPDVCEKLRPLCEVEEDPEYQKWCQNALDEDGPELTAVRNTAKELTERIKRTGSWSKNHRTADQTPLGSC